MYTISLKLYATQAGFPTSLAAGAAVARHKHDYYKNDCNIPPQSHPLRHNNMAEAPNPGLLDLEKELTCSVSLPPHAKKIELPTTWLARDTS